MKKYDPEKIENKWPSSAKATDGKQKYDPAKIESKWQDIWAKNQPGKAEDFSDKPKHYHLVEFPYPSGAGLHVGHCMGYGASDAYCRMKRMQGFNVMYPIGWDAFGLPTENYAIKTGRKPADVTRENTDNFRKQMHRMGFSFDWDREVNTSDPNYYKWTQWIFLQFYRHGIVNDKLVEVADDDTTTPRLAYQAEIAINWCPSCKIGLANEEVIAGKCERCGSEVVKKMQKQWMLRITAYADRLISDLDKVDYLDKIKTQQINWIGKSTGTNILFELKTQNSKLKTNEASPGPDYIEVFTTRADTLFGCTYVVLAPEHPLVQNLESRIMNYDEVAQYIGNSKKKSDMERTELAKEKTGVELKGIKAINPINGEEVSVWVADYVLASYGTGAVMAVPAHDERDWEFAKKYGIEIKDVVVPREGEPHKGAEFRRTASAVIQRKSDKKFLLIKWNKFGWISPVAGGIDDGEDPKEAIVREVYEETGYKVKVIENLGGIVESHFFAKNKNVWRHRHDQHILCELISDEPDDVDGEEKDRHDAIWLSAKEALAKITHPYNKIGVERFLKGNYSFTDYGYLINSNDFNGLSSEEAKKKITDKLKEKGAGDFSINYKLRDWVFSRQHYWGEPIPIVYCAHCAQNNRKSEIRISKSETSTNFTIIDGKKHMLVPVPEDQLPVTLPDVENYQPTNTGESPLAAISDWVNTTCPKCGGKARRETDTMPNWAGSSWYFLAYATQGNPKSEIRNPKLKGNLFDSNANELKYWMPVDLYNGGMEHTTLHLLYSRFWHKFLYDLGKAPGSEPYQKRIAHGIILGPDGRKMSKSFGNVINPDDIVKQFGADTTRAYIMFIGPYDAESSWSMAGVQGVSRFLNRVFNNADKASSPYTDTKEFLVKLNQTIAGVTDDIESFRLNTVVSKLMELNNAIESAGKVSTDSFKVFLQLLFPVVPHLASELWSKIDKESIENVSWPTPDEKFLIAEEIEIVVQINGKVRDRIIVDSSISDEELKKVALDSERVQAIIKDQQIIKTIIVPKKLVSIVTKLEARSTKSETNHKF